MMTNLLLDITSATIDWSRAQFALTAIYHWLFVPLTLGLAVIMGIAETCYYRTNKPFWKHVTRFWQKLFGVNFAMGVATGIILEFEFGTNRVEARFEDGTILSIDCIVIEDEYGNTPAQRAELDWLLI